jgi:hypothetical protein
LGRLLARGPAADPAAAKKAIAEVQEAGRSMKDSLGALRLRGARNWDKFRQKLRPAQADGRAAAARKYDLLLDLPLWRADERAALWEDARDLSRRLNQGTDEEDKNDGRRRLPSLTGGTATDEPRRAARRARLAIALLQLGGLDEDTLGPLRQALRQAEKDGAKPGAWHPLAHALREALTAKAREQLSRLLLKKTLLAADRLGRILHPFDLADLPALGGTGDHPAVRLRRQEAAEQWRWLGERYQKRATAGDNAPFYGTVAAAYLECAGR